MHLAFAVVVAPTALADVTRAGTPTLFSRAQTALRRVIRPAARARIGQFRASSHGRLLTQAIHLSNVQMPLSAFRVQSEASNASAVVAMPPSERQILHAAEMISRLGTVKALSSYEQLSDSLPSYESFESLERDLTEHRFALRLANRATENLRADSAPSTSRWTPRLANRIRGAIRRSQSVLNAKERLFRRMNARLVENALAGPLTGHSAYPNGAYGRALEQTRTMRSVLANGRHLDLSEMELNQLFAAVEATQNGGPLFEAVQTDPRFVALMRAVDRALDERRI